MVRGWMPLFARSWGRWVMASEWKLAKLSDVAAINPPRKVRKGKLAPFIEMAALPLSRRDIAATDVETRTAKAAGAHFQNGDTLLARITPCLENGKTAQVNILPNGAIGEGSTEFIVLCGHDPADNDYVYYMCRDPEFRDFAISRMEGTSGRQRVSWQSISGYQLDLPPPEVRRAGAKLLATLDDRINSLRQTNTTLEAIAAALFKSWFVDFDGVGQEDMQESELGLIPKGWQVVNFGELLESSIGGDWGKEQPEDDHDQRVCIIRGTDFPDLKIGGKGGVPCRYTTKKKMASRLLQEGDIIIEVSGGSPTQPTGRSVRITNSILARFDNPVVCASFCRRFRPKNLALGTLAACHLNALYQAGGTWEYQNQSTGISNFQTTHFLEAEKVALPPEDVVDRFYQMVNPFLEQMTTNQSMTVAILRDTLLPRLISGQLRATNTLKA